MTTYTPARETPQTTQSEASLQYPNRVRRHTIIMIVLGVFFTLFTYQYFHHGLWGKLNNYNKLPLIVLNGTTVTTSSLNLTLYRPNGPDTYGSFVEKVTLTIPQSTNPLETWTPAMLANVGKNAIHNVYQYQHIKTGPWGLVVPLAAKATINLPLSSTVASALQHAGKAEVTVEDVSGVQWTYTTTVK